MAATPAVGRQTSGRVTIIRSRQPGVLARLAEFWHYRALLGFFARNNVRKMYANTWLGWIWIPLRPAWNIALRALVFGTLLKAPSDGIPYFLFYACGIAGWECFARTWYLGTRSLEISRRLLKRLYVPRLIVLTASGTFGIVELVLYGSILVIGLGWYVGAEGHLYLNVGWSLLLAPAALVLMLLLALSLSLWTSVYGAQARDPRFIVRHILRFMHYSTPIIYPISAVPHGLSTVVDLNPLTAPMELLRMGVFGVGNVSLTAGLSTAVAILVFGIPGLRFFTKSEARALDHL